jgi:hypothetical protein
MLMEYGGSSISSFCFGNNIRLTINARGGGFIATEYILPHHHFGGKHYGDLQQCLKDWHMMF